MQTAFKKPQKETKKNEIIVDAAVNGSSIRKIRTKIRTLKDFVGFAVAAWLNLQVKQNKQRLPGLQEMTV